MRDKDLGVSLKASYLLKKNIDTLLQARKETRKDLAQWCRRTESWLSQIFTNEQRGIPIKYLDRIADYFGIDTFQLFLPGIDTYTERRKGDRRKQDDRRIKRAFPMLSPPSAAEMTAKLARLSPEVRRKAEYLLDAFVATEGVGRKTEGSPDDGGTRAAGAGRAPRHRK